MAVITSSIGSAGRDYSTVQAWEDALPTTGTDSQVGECYNDSELSSSGITFAGTTNSSRTVTLTCAAGHSFRDSAGVQDNALRYNVANGVGITRSGNYTTNVVISEDYVMLRGLQIRGTGAHSSALDVAQNCDNGVIEDCIFESNADATTLPVVAFRSGVMRNCLLVARAASIGDGLQFGYTSGATKAINCTIVHVSNTSGSSGIRTSTGSPQPTVKNCAIFGFAALCNNVAHLQGSNNASDLAIGFGTNNQASKVYVDQFRTTVTANSDFRLKAGSQCIDTGVTDATNGTPDIAGTARPVGEAYDIGCWEKLPRTGFPMGLAGNIKMNAGGMGQSDFIS